MNQTNERPSPNGVSRYGLVLDTVATLAMIVAAVVLLWKVLVPSAPVAPRRARTLLVPHDLISLEGAAISGNERARVVLIEYSDFECPFCARFVRESLPEIKKTFVDTGRLLLAFRNLPLPIHRHAEKAAKMAVCASRQGRFWDIHDALFARQEDLSEPVMEQIAKTLDLDIAALNSCRGGPASEQLRKEVAEAEALGISSTPAFFLGTIGGDRRVKVKTAIAGARPIEEFVRAIEALLAGT